MIGRVGLHMQQNESLPSRCFARLLSSMLLLMLTLCVGKLVQSIVDLTQNSSLARLIAVPTDLE